MFVNLHNLPAGKAMYTVCITDDPRETPADRMSYDEVDVVAGDRATVAQVLEACHDELAEGYASTARVVGIIHQSGGFVLAEDPQGDLR